MPMQLDMGSTGGSPNARRARTRARIVAAAFELFGRDVGSVVRIEDIAAAAGVTRMTFYNHFAGMAALREAVAFELTHDFLTAVTQAISRLPDPRERAAAAIRLYIRRVGDDPGWGRSLLNLSADGLFFGAETHAQAARTVAEGIAEGRFSGVDSAAGRDLVLGTALAAIAGLLAGKGGIDRAEMIAAAILRGLGVAADIADEIARRPLPPLAWIEQT